MYFWVIIVNEKKLETFLNSWEMKVSTIIQLGGEANFELKNSKFWIVSEIIELISLKNELGISLSSPPNSVSSISSERTRFRKFIHQELISQSGLVKLH